MDKSHRAAIAGIILLVWAAVASTSVFPKFRLLHFFNGTDGAYPDGLVQTADGYLYGATLNGGTISCGYSHGCGTVFKMTPGGILTTIYSFCSQGAPCTDGYTPRAAPIQAVDGSLYGTTSGDGINNYGTVFRISPNGNLATLYRFCSQSGCMDGSQPWASLIQGTDGNFYGTTSAGGMNKSCGYGCGTVFRITANGALTTLYSFCSLVRCADGENPTASMVEGTDGAFYGATSVGGVNGDGTVFKITSSGLLTTLHNFCSEENCADGSGPNGLVQAANGNFYGTTYWNGAYDGGTVFEMTPGGALTTLFAFCSRIAHGLCVDGNLPEAGLVQGTDGNFYGTTAAGGPNYCGPFLSCGTLFRITPSGTLTTLHNFDDTSGGSSVAPIQNTNGAFYGTTDEGANDGTVFGLSMGLGPFVNTNPAAGKVGAKVGILGTDLTGATSVTFNGTETAFRVVSKTFIEAKVPSGAATGKVQVQLPSGTLTSNVPFIVLQ
jgi:uncharacterized repeat protein (TIGR03803 family)